MKKKFLADRYLKMFKSIALAVSYTHLTLPTN